MQVGDTITKGKFSYILVKETEKAILAKVPYWKKTNEYQKLHIQEFFEAWIPKFILAKSDVEIKMFLVDKKLQIKNSNSYQKKFSPTQPEYYKTFGEFRPEKKQYSRQEIDFETVQSMANDLLVKCKVSDMKHILNEEGELDGVENPKEAYELAKALYFPSLQKELTPKKDVVYYE